MNLYNLVMAGGGGTRFWPLSRKNMPKQLLSLSGKDVMINETIIRCESLIKYSDTYIVTNINQVKGIDNVLLKSIPRENILSEPLAKNTAPCILYAIKYILEAKGDGVVCVFPSDHYIEEKNGYLKILEKGIKLAESMNTIVTIGVIPKFPATGYGYIEKSDDLIEENAYRIQRFVEKPNMVKAREYISTGNYFWNSGVFIFKISSLLEQFKRFLPRLYRAMSKLDGRILAEDSTDLLMQIYSEIDNISIDYGIMERMDDAIVIPGDFGWNDVGSWDTLGTMFPTDDKGNIVNCDHVGVDTKECIIYGNKKLIATVGIYNTVVVDTNDAILICNKNRAQDVKQIVDILTEQNRYDLL